MKSYTVTGKFCLVNFTILIFLLYCTNGCNSNPSSKKETGKNTEKQKTAKKDTTLKGNFQTASGIVFDSTAIEHFLAEKKDFKEFSNDFYNFYRAKNFNYVWYSKDGLIETAKTLVATIENMKDEGLSARIPYEDEYLQIANYNDQDNSNGNNKPDINKELMLTGQYFNYAKHAWGGTVNEKVEGWYIPRKKLNYSELLESNISNLAFETDVNSIVVKQYTALKEALAKYRKIEQEIPDTTLSSLKKISPVKPGDSAEIVAHIRKRLNKLGLPAEDNGSNVSDTLLANAIRLFKQTYGLKADALIDNEMIKTLNVPIKKRIEQILVNMERMRWLPSKVNANEFILVNIPQYMLHYYENGKNVWSCNVVVGKPMHKTVIFTGKMQHVVFSPYWNVPPSILNNEIKPAIRRNPGYLASHNMEWNGGNVRQRPGKNNALGLVKFIFPNANNIYLHDSPSKSLFNEPSRAFSHGCIRVAKPKELAMRILKQDPSWTEEKIDAAMHAGKERYVTLKEQIPVYIGYFTAFVDKDGYVNFRPDIYNRDASLLAMIMQ